MILKIYFCNSLLGLRQEISQLNGIKYSYILGLWVVPKTLKNVNLCDLNKVLDSVYIDISMDNYVFIVSKRAIQASPSRKY